MLEREVDPVVIADIIKLQNRAAINRIRSFFANPVVSEKRSENAETAGSSAKIKTADQN